MTDELARHWERIATPSRFAMAVSEEFMGQKYLPFPWILAVEERILDAINDPEQRFIILNVPPQSGKTTTFGMFLIAWYLGMHPERQALFIAYAEEYAASWGLKTKNLLAKYGPQFFGVDVSSQQAASNNWKTSNGFGGMLSAGILGGITGNPGHLIVIDDVIKTMEEAMSPTTKAKHLNEYDAAISSRFQDVIYGPDGELLQEGTTVIITATRFAEDDLSGSLIERMAQPGYQGEQWEVISIPALAEPPEDHGMDAEQLAEWTDFLGRKEGEGLAGRFRQNYYERRKASISPMTWAAVYQQQPSVRDGGMFPIGEWRYWTPGTIGPDVLPQITRTTRVWDLATTEGGGDWTVGTLMGIGVNGDLYILDRVRGRWSTSEVERRLLATAASDGRQVKVLIEQEKAGAGKTVVESFKRKLPGYFVEGAKIEGSKEQRAWAYSEMQQVRRVWLPAEAEWKTEWTKEHKQMMGDGRLPKHDDQIDTGAYGALDLLGSGVTEMWVPGDGDGDGDGDGTVWSEGEDEFMSMLSANGLLEATLGANPFFDGSRQGFVDHRFG